MNSSGGLPRVARGDSLSRGYSLKPLRGIEMARGIHRLARAVREATRGTTSRSAVRHQFARYSPQFYQLTRTREAVLRREYECSTNQRCYP